MKITVFDVEHGACALITSDNGLAHALVDCGHSSNSLRPWRPSEHLPQKLGIFSIDKLFVTNYDLDHVSDFPNVMAKMNVKVLVRNISMNGSQLLTLKASQCPEVHQSIQSVAHHMDGTFTDTPYPQPNWGNIEFRAYCHKYPCDFTETNNLSLAVFVLHPSLKILFAGDMEVEGWRKHLLNPEFVAYLKQVDILVASHHGRRNGYCEEIFTQTGWNPRAVLISDDYKQYESQETVPLYRNRVVEAGVNMADGSKRHVLTTRKDGTITMDALPNGNGFNISTSGKNGLADAITRALAPQPTPRGLSDLGRPTSFGSLLEQSNPIGLTSTPTSTSFSIPSSVLFGLGTKK